MLESARFEFNDQETGTRKLGNQEIGKSGNWDQEAGNPCEREIVETGKGDLLCGLWQRSAMPMDVGVILRALCYRTQEMGLPADRVVFPSSRRHIVATTYIPESGGPGARSESECSLCAVRG